MFLIQNMRIVNAYELASRGMFLLTKGNGQELSLMSGERSFLNLFRDSRTSLDSIRDKLVTLIFFCHCSMPECWDDVVQCELCEEWLHMSCEGFKTAPEGEWPCIVCRLPDSRRLRNC